MLGLMQGGFVYLGLSVSVWYKFGSRVVKCVVARVCSLGQICELLVVIVQCDTILCIVG